MRDGRISSHAFALRLRSAEQGGSNVPVLSCNGGLDCRGSCFDGWYFGGGGTYSPQKPTTGDRDDPDSADGREGWQQRTF
jgi:hypothetical protein